jgi:membrane protease YdiL (CAAX protease family)
MIGPLLLALSWLLLRIEGRGLASIGIDQPRRRSRELAFGFGFMGAVAAAQQVGLSVASGDRFMLNPTLSPAAVFDNLRFTVNSVLYEELVFRGYVLYQAVRFLGRRWAVALDATAFGTYHWFSYGVIGNPVAMV